MSELDPLNPGQILKQAREKLGLSLNDIAVATKINPRVLKALEEGQKEALPPRSFVRGFIRSYANYLKLKPEPILEAFEMGDTPVSIGSSPTPAQENDPSPAKSSRSDVSRLEQSSKVGTIMVAIGIVVLIVLIFGVKNMMDKYASERVVDKPAAEESVEGGSATVAAPAEGENVEPAAGTEPTSPEPASATAVGVTATPAESPVSAPASEVKADTEAKAAAEKKAAELKAAEEKKASAEKLAAEKKSEEEKMAAEKKAATEKAATEKLASEKAATEKAAAEKKAATEKAATEKAAADKKAADAKFAAAAAAAEKVAETKPTPAAKPGTPQEVIIEALDDVQITVTVDGGGSKKVTLKPESVYTVKAKSDVSLEVSDGGLVNIIHNGNDRGNPGSLGKSAKVKYP